MKIAVCSDLHLEFGHIELKNTEQAQVLILSGDICVAKDLYDVDNVDLDFGKSIRYHEFFKTCASEFEQVIYIAGNHEHYHYDYAKTISDLHQKLGYLNNLHILDKKCITFGDVAFIGGTLWTDMNKEDPVTLAGIKHYMNDYKVIRNTNSVDVTFRGMDGTMQSRPAKFSPEDSVVDHKAMLEFIDNIIGGGTFKKYVVVGHHAPSKLSTKPEYEDDVLVNGAYSSDLSEFILDRPEIKLWTHGHTHHEFDYMIGDTRIVCNPRGYINYEEQANDFKLKYVEV